MKSMKKQQRSHVGLRRTLARLRRHFLVLWLLVKKNSSQTARPLMLARLIGGFP